MMRLMIDMIHESVTNLSLSLHSTYGTLWQVTCGILAGAGHALENGGLLIVYGPFKATSSEPSS